MHTLWSGSISFGLINIPVLLFSAAKERALEFSLLRKKDFCPISYTRVCQTDGKEVAYEDIVKGYEYREGKYITVDEDDFKRAAAEKNQRIDIDVFVSEQEIESKYFDKPYYLGPDKGAEKAYVLLRQALSTTGKVAVARIVFRAKEDLVVIKPEGDLLILNQLRYQDEIRDASELDIPKKVDVSREEIEMAVKLIDHMKGKFDPKKYKDTYAEKLKKIIQSKAKGQKLKSIPQAPLPTKPVDLASQLRASLHS